MLSGATWSAAAIAGTAVLRIVVSSDSIKNATAISHGSRRLLEPASVGWGKRALIESGGLAFVGVCCIGLRDFVHDSLLRCRRKFGGRFRLVAVAFRGQRIRPAQ